MIPEYSVKLEQYEGPFHVLLDLIKKREMDIFDLQISVITKDFLDYLERNKELNIELTSYFMDMASTLVQIKAEMLLPKNEKREDPRKKLVEEILDYQKYKEGINNLKELGNQNLKFFKRNKQEVLTKEKKLSLDILSREYSQLFMKKFKEGKQNERENRFLALSQQLIQSKFTIEERIEFIKKMMNEKPLDVILFFEQIEEREEMVVSFSAVLELVKSQYALVEVTSEEKILLMKRGD